MVLSGKQGAGAAFLVLGSMGVSRPNDRPTADAPTTVAVAHSYITQTHQSWRLVQNSFADREGKGTTRVQLRAPEHRGQRSRAIYQNKTSAMTAPCIVGIQRPWDGTGAGRVVFTDGTVFILAKNRAAGDKSLVEAPVTTSRALWHVKELGEDESRAALCGQERR